MNISKSTLPFVSGALIALLAIAAPVVAQTTAREALSMRSGDSQKARITEVISAHTGGERSTIINLWDYALSDDALLYCGYRVDAQSRTNGFAVMDGVESDTVVLTMTEDSFREAGCARPGFTPLTGALPADPLAGVRFDVAERPAPAAATSTYKVFQFPYDRANEPTCMAGRALAYEAVVRGNTSAVTGFPREMLADDTQLFGLCYNASGQEFINVQIGRIAADADARMAPLRARAYLAQASLYLNRMRARGSEQSALYRQPRAF